MSDADRFVYFIRYGADGPIKIGSSADPEQRLAALQIGTPTPLTIVAEAPGGFAEEVDLHRRFAHRRLGGEWFAPEVDIIALVSAVAERGVLPPLPPMPKLPAPAESLLSWEMGPRPRPGPDALHLYLAEQQLSARAFAARAGLPARSVQEWLAGGAIPRADRAADLQRATGGAVRADAW